MKILLVMGSLMLLVFALNLGVASAHDGGLNAPDRLPAGAAFDSGHAVAASSGNLGGGAHNAELRNPNCGQHAGFAHGG